MKSSSPRVLWAVGVAAIVAATWISAKPPATPRKDSPSPAPATAAGSPAEPGADFALARWLVQANGEPDAIVLPFAQVVRAATGKNVLPFEAANTSQAATLARIGAALDLILPRMNRPESSAHAAAAILGDAAVVATRFEDELRTALGASPPFAAASLESRRYPAMRLVDQADGRTYYLAVTLYPTGGNPAGRALAFAPAEALPRLPSDGCCLLVGIEHDGKPGRDMAFLNWEVLDLARLKIRFRPVFEADEKDALQPGAVLTDGRKGRD